MEKNHSLFAVLLIACGIFAYIHWSHHPSLHGAREKAFVVACAILVVGPAAVRKITRKEKAKFDLARDLCILLGEIITGAGIAMAAEFLISQR